MLLNRENLIVPMVSGVCIALALAGVAVHRVPSPRPIDVTGQPCSPDRGPAVRQNLVSSRGRRRISSDPGGVKSRLATMPVACRSTPALSTVVAVAKGRKVARRGTASAKYQRIKRQATHQRAPGGRAAFR